MNLAYSEKYTVKDHSAWNGDWELVHGEAFAMPPSPLYDHQYINGKIFRQLDELLDTCSKCHAVIETDVAFADDTVVRPDSMVICYEPTQKLTKAPDLVFEVISKSTAKRDEILKLDLYQAEAIKYYVIIYPDSNKAKLYKLIDHKYQKLGDFSNEHFLFELNGCEINFDFSFIWRKK